MSTQEYKITQYNTEFSKTISGPIWSLRGGSRPSVEMSADLSGEVQIRGYQVGDYSMDQSCIAERSAARCSDKGVAHLVLVG